MYDNRLGNITLELLYITLGCEIYYTLMGNKGCTALYYTMMDNKGYITLWWTTMDILYSITLWWEIRYISHYDEQYKIYIALWWVIRDILNFYGQQDIYSITVHYDG